MSEAFSYQRLGGKFVVFEGPDGCGKTTQMELLMDKALAEGLTVRRLREPGGTPIGEQIRTVLLSKENEEMDLRCEMLLYMASRAQLVSQQIKPALARGEMVLADRYASSTLAYQGGGGGMSVEHILQVAEIAVDGTWPDLTIVFDLPIESAMERLNPLYGRKDKDQAMGLFELSAVQDRIEQRNREYFERVRRNYLEQAMRWPERYRVVDASKSIKQVKNQVERVLGEFFR